MLSTWFDDVQHLDPRTLSQLMRMGSRVGRLLELTSALRGQGQSRNQESSLDS